MELKSVFIHDQLWREHQGAVVGPQIVLGLDSHSMDLVMFWLLFWQFWQTGTLTGLLALVGKKKVFIIII